jgi:multidrug efflux pump subunit AcrA (membrane-fusion protein)
MTAACAASKPVKTEEGLMVRFNALMVAASAACLAASGLSALAAESTVKKGAPARVEATTDAKIKKITLTPKAAERLGIVIDEVRADPSGRRIVPYASVLYDLTGKTWVYISAEPLTFVRGPVEIDTIKGDNVYLSDGPPTGTKVLAAGVPQVFGTEVKVGH